MVYTAGSMLLEEAAQIFNGSVNDIVICKSLNALNETYYTVHIIKDHKLAKQLLSIMEQAQESVISFSWKGKLCFLFPYEEERPIYRFFDRNSMTLQLCEQLCMELLIECIKCTLPYPILYLILNQWKIQIRKDNSLYFSYQIDFSELNPEIGESRCVQAVAGIILQILGEDAGHPAASIELIQKKVRKQAYTQFTSLFHDIKVSAQSDYKRGIKKKINHRFETKKDSLLRLLFTVCICVTMVAFFMLLSKLIYGEFPFQRIFTGGFRTIGTESMLQ